MKKLLLALAITACFAGSAAAQIGWGADNIGVYFDAAGASLCGMEAPGNLATVYIVITNPQYGVAGWEARVETVTNGGSYVLTWALNGVNPLNTQTVPEFQVGLGLPFEKAPAIAVATGTVFVADDLPLYFYVHPIFKPSTDPNDPNAVPMCYYAVDYDPDILLPLYPKSSDYELPVAQLNGDCLIIGAENDTWGGVKSLYQ